MKILVLAEKYSTIDKVSQGFIHTRNCEYIKSNIEVDVISFALKEGKYTLDGIEIYSLKEFYKEKKIQEYDIVVSHAPNIRNHCKFINKNYKYIKKLMFFFHGHEVLYSKEVYPKPYDYVKKENKVKETIRDIYDIYKMKYMTKFLKNKLDKSTFIFVSEWMYEQFKKNIKLNENLYKDKSHIIYNALGNVFLESSYDLNSEKEYDFITIRNMLDGSKYCIDIVNELAKKYSKYKFLVIGKGEFFEHNSSPNNLEYKLVNLNHKEVIEYLNKSKYALMPTRADAQGVMMCEIATYGMPLITSNIYVCRKVLGGLENVKLIENDIEKIDLEKTIKDLKPSKEKTSRFSYENTIKKEIELLIRIKEEEDKK